MLFHRTERSGVHVGGHRRWPAAGQASPFHRPRAVAALPLPTDPGTGAALLAQPAPLIASGQQLRSGRGGPWGSVVSVHSRSDTGLIMSPKMRRHCEQISPSSATRFEHPARTHPVNICGSTIVSALGAFTIGIGFRAVRRRARLGRKPDSPVRVRSVRRPRRGGSRRRAWATASRAVTSCARVSHPISACIPPNPTNGTDERSKITPPLSTMARVNSV